MTSSGNDRVAQGDLGVLRKTQRTNKLNSSMRNQVTLFVNYSYKAKRRLCVKIWCVSDDKGVVSIFKLISTNMFLSIK